MTWSRVSIILSKMALGLKKNSTWAFTPSLHAEELVAASCTSSSLHEGGCEIAIVGRLVIDRNRWSLVGIDDSFIISDINS